MKASDFDILIPQPTPEQLVKPRWGVVTQISPLRVKLDGDDVQLPVTPSSLVAGLAVNDRVWMVLVERQVVIAGKYGGTPFPAIPEVGKVTRVARSTNYNNGSAWFTIPWETEVFDDAGAWTPGNATKIITPAGFTRAHVTLYTAWTVSSVTSGRFSAITQNGHGFIASALAQMYETTSTITTGWVPTVAGDEFTGRANAESTTPQLLGAGVWGGPTWMEVIFR